MRGSSGTSTGSIFVRFFDGSMSRWTEEGEGRIKEREVGGERQGLKEDKWGIFARKECFATKARAPSSFRMGQGVDSDVCL